MTADSSTKKRQLDTPRARSQQRGRLRKTLFKKGYIYSVECDADVYMVIRLRGTGRIFTFQSDSTEDFSPSLRELATKDHFKELHQSKRGFN
uniref:MADS-box protein SVP n=1 Tax=Talaromyces marneffei PM1 TaxID=1077442 RepID=A0A093XCA2_TALMA